MTQSFADFLSDTLPAVKEASGIKPWAVPNIAQGGHTMATTGKVVGGAMGGGAMGGGASEGGGAVTPVDTQSKSKEEEEQPAAPPPANPMDASLQMSGVDPAGVTQQHEMAQSEADLAKAKAEAEVQKLQQSAAPKGGGMETMSPAIQAHQMTLDHQKQMASNMAKEFGNLSSRRLLDQRIKATMSKIQKVVGSAGVLPHQIKLAATLITLRSGHDFSKSAFMVGNAFKPAAPSTAPKPMGMPEPSNLSALTKARTAGNTKAVQAAGGTVGGALLRDQNIDMTNRSVKEYGHTGPLGMLHNGANLVANGIGSMFGHEESSRNFDAFLHPFQSPALNKIQEDATKPLAPGELVAYKNPDAQMVERQQAMTDTAVKDNNSNAATSVYDRVTGDPGNTPYGTDGSVASRLGNGSFRMARGAYRNFFNIADQADSGSLKRMAFGDAGADPNATWRDKGIGLIGDSLPSHLLQGVAGMNPAGTIRDIVAPSPTSLLQKLRGVKTPAPGSAAATLAKANEASAGAKALLTGAEVYGEHSMAKNTAPSETAQGDAVQAMDQNTLDTMKQNGGHLPGERSGFGEILNWILSLVGMGQGPSQAQQRLQGFDARQNLIAPAH